jgi:hypothetical protein
MMNGRYSKMKVASVAAAIALGLWATNADAGHRWRRGGGHHGGHHNNCYNYGGSSHGNVVSDCGDAYNGCGQTSNWQGGVCGDHHGYAQQSPECGQDHYAVSVTSSGCGSHGSHNAAYHGQSNYYGQSGHYGEHQHSQAGQSYETMRPEDQQGQMYGEPEMAPPPPPYYGPQDANSRDGQRREQNSDNNNSDSDRDRAANDRDSNSDPNRDENSDNNESANDRDQEDRSDDNAANNSPTSDTPAAQ